METAQLRRRFGRIAAEKAVLLEQAAPEPAGMFAVTRDLGPGGCGVVSPTSLGPGSVFKMYLSIDSEVLEADGLIVHERSRPDGRYDVGFEILQMDQVHRARYNLRFDTLAGDPNPRPRTPRAR